MATFLVAVLWASSALAQPEITIDAGVDRGEVEPHQTIRYEVEVSVAGNFEIELAQRPDFGDFTVVGRHTSPRFRIHNGRAQRSLTLQYQLRAPSTGGVYTFTPPQFRIASRTIRPDPITVTVTGDAREPVTAAPPDNVGNRTAFVHVTLDPDRDPYVGEQLILTHDLYVNQRERALRPTSAGEPALDDFWVHELTRDLPLRRSQERIDGQVWVVTPLRVQAIFPLRPGTATIDAIEVPLARTSLFGRGGEERIRSESFEIDVQPLPSGAPAGFSSPNIGRWEMETSLDSSSARVGGQLQVTVRISGTGRPERLGEPAFEVPPQFRLLNVRDDYSRALRHGRVGGERVFTYQLMPLEPGEFSLPEFLFSYFDPDREQYVTHRSQSHSVTVEPGELPADVAEDISQVARGESWADRSPLEELRDLVDEGALKEQPPTPLPVWPYLIPLIGLLLLALERPLTRPLKRKLSPMIWRRSLESKIDAALAEDEPSADRCLRALRICLIDGLGLVVGALDTKEVRQVLQTCEIDDSLRHQCLDLVEALVAQRYAPPADRSPQAHEEQTRELIAGLLDWKAHQRAAAAAKATMSSTATTVLLLSGWTALAALALVGHPSPAFAEDAEDAENWEQLAGDWHQRIIESPTDITAHYNAGTAAAKAGDLGSARLYLERALWLGGDDPRIRENLMLVTDAVGARAPAFTAFHQQSTPLVVLHSNAPWLVGVLLWASLLLALLRRVRGIPHGKNHFFAALISLLALAVLATGGWIYVERFARQADLAVVMVDDQPVLEAPSAHSAPAVDSLLPAGAVLRVRQERDGWLHVQLPTGSTGWMSGDEVTSVPHH